MYARVTVPFVRCVVRRRRVVHGGCFKTAGHPQGVQELWRRQQWAGGRRSCLHVGGRLRVKNPRRRRRQPAVAVLHPPVKRGPSDYFSIRCVRYAARMRVRRVSFFGRWSVLGRDERHRNRFVRNGKPRTIEKFVDQQVTFAGARARSRRKQTTS